MLPLLCQEIFGYSLKKYRSALPFILLCVLLITSGTPWGTARASDLAPNASSVHERVSGGAGEGFIVAAAPEPPEGSPAPATEDQEKAPQPAQAPALAPQEQKAQDQEKTPGANTPAKPSAPSIRLFGTVEFRGPLKQMPKWERVLNAELRNPTFDGDLRPFMSASLVKQWEELSEQLRGAPLKDKLRGVNTFFNRWPYRTDQALYGIEDYWATPAEFLKKSGDCEDYAITKFFALKKLGVPPESMRVVALIDQIRNIGHAILVVYSDGDAYVLDNLTDMVMSHERYRQYAPQYSVNEMFRWAHVKPTTKK